MDGEIGELVCGSRSGGAAEEEGGDEGLVGRKAWKVKGERWAKRGRNSGVVLDGEERDDKDYSHPGQ